MEGNPRLLTSMRFRAFPSGQGSDLRSPGSPEVKLISRVAPYSSSGRARSRRRCVEIPREQSTYSHRLRSRVGLHRAQRVQGGTLIVFLKAQAPVQRAQWAAPLHERPRISSRRLERDYKISSVFSASTIDVACYSTLHRAIYSIPRRKMGLDFAGT
jgi:hypothetical protein